DDKFFARAIAAASAAREGMQDPAHTACRLVHAECDGLPGVIADRYGETIVVQLLSAGAERWRHAITSALNRVPGVQCVYERSDAEVRSLEGLPPRAGVVTGTLPPAVEIIEGGLR